MTTMFDISSLIDAIAARVADHLIARGYKVIVGDAIKAPIKDNRDTTLRQTADGNGAISGDVKDNTQPRRRRRADSPTEPSAPSAGAATASEPNTDAVAPRRRRRGQSEAAPTTPPAPSEASQGASGATAADAGNGRRRRGSAPAAEQKISSGTDEKISDADLMKAASAAAQKITPAGVMAIIEQYADKLQSIEQKDRKGFLAELRIKVENAA